MNNPYFWAIGGLGILDLFLILLLSWRFRKYKKIQTELLRGAEAENLEELVLEQKKILQSHRRNLKDLGTILEELVERNKINIQKTGLVRFNSFADAGGNMSFVLALLDANDDGIVISSLHGREGTRIYGKTIERGRSPYNLTEEEQLAIARAKKATNH